MQPDSFFFKPFITNLLSVWADKAVCANGFFDPFFSRTWEQGSEHYGTPVSQSRLLYNFCCAFHLTGESRYREAVLKGADFLISNFWDTEKRGWFCSVSEDGKILDSSKDSYFHAFALFGLSHAYELCGKSEYLNYALNTIDVMDKYFRDPSGGYCRRMTQDFRTLDTQRSQNPVMHYFEALTALYAVGNEGTAADKALETAEFIFSRCYDKAHGCIPEFYTEEWERLPSSEKGYADAGHQCEWAFLVSEAERLGLTRDYAEQGHALLDFSIRCAYDPEYGGIGSACTPEKKLIRGAKGWWQQCEAVRALHRYAAVLGRDDLAGRYAQSVSFIKNYYIDPEYGGFYSSLTQDRTPKDTAKGNTWKVDYHVTGMCMEIVKG